MKQFGPLLLVWGSAMAMLLVTREIGTSLMFFGAFLALLYVATGRFSFPLDRPRAVRARRLLPGHARRAHPPARARLGAPLRAQALPPGRAAATSSRTGLFAQADGGLLGVGFDQSISRGFAHLLPVAESDSIYAVITNEVGLVGAIGLLVVYCCSSRAA
jgi:cell division protein FtsW (lipid II flippase)